MAESGDEECYKSWEWFDSRCVGRPGAAGLGNATSESAASLGGSEICLRDLLPRRLTPLGVEQATALAPKLRAYRFSVVLVSPLSRAIQTARLAIGEVRWRIRPAARPPLRTLLLVVVLVGLVSPPPSSFDPSGSSLRSL